MKQKKPLHTTIRKPNAPPGKVFKNDGKQHVLESILEREAEEAIANESAKSGNNEGGS